jgi:hypothetical protein
MHPGRLSRRERRDVVAHSELPCVVSRATGMWDPYECRIHNCVWCGIHAREGMTARGLQCGWCMCHAGLWGDSNGVLMVLRSSKCVECGVQGDLFVAVRVLMRRVQHMQGGSSCCDWVAGGHGAMVHAHAYTTNSSRTRSAIYAIANGILVQWPVHAEPQLQSGTQN